MPQTPDHISKLLAGSDFDLWQAVALGTRTLLEASPELAVTAIQNIAWSTWVASGLIGNGGFYYGACSPDELAKWADAYDEIGLSQAAEAMRKADPIVRQLQSTDGEGESLNDELDRLERQFYDADGQTKGRVAQLIRRRPAEAFSGFG